MLSCIKLRVQSTFSCVKANMFSVQSQTFNSSFMLLAATATREVDRVALPWWYVTAPVSVVPTGCNTQSQSQEAKYDSGYYMMFIDKLNMNF